MSGFVAGHRDGGLWNLMHGIVACKKILLSMTATADLIVSRLFPDWKIVISVEEPFFVQ